MIATSPDAGLPMDREVFTSAPNPLGIAGIEFVEYATVRPQAFGDVLERMGFRLIARHRSREVLLYRQGSMNVVVNAHESSPEDDLPPRIAAIALRVRNAEAAWQHVVDRGGWPVPVKVNPMELHIPGVHAAGDSRIYFVDRWTNFSIYDIDFVAVPTVQPDVPAVEGLHWFGVVQYIAHDRTAPWSVFYSSLFGFTELDAEQRFGILPRGSILASPCGTFYLQLVEPDALVIEDTREYLQRVAFGAPDVQRLVAVLRERGVEFVEADSLHTEERGALTRPYLGSVSFELVRHRLPASS